MMGSIPVHLEHLFSPLKYAMLETVCSKVCVKSGEFMIFPTMAIMIR